MRVLVLGLLLPAVLVSGQTIVAPTNTAAGTTANSMSTARAGTTDPAATSAGSMGASTQSGGSTPAPAVMTAGATGTASMTSMTSSSPTQMMTTQASYQSSTSGVNGTSSTNYTVLSCPSFICNYSDCNMMYTNQTPTACADGYCQLVRQTDMCYTVSCSDSCAPTCTNSSQTNCSMNCCNTTNCLNETFASMIMTTMTTMPATPTTPATTSMMTTKPPTTADNGNKCHGATCTGDTCYTGFNTPQKCSSTQTHCQLKKETTTSGAKWTAGCTTNCSSETSCKSSTKPPCQLECCVATTSSCLFLNGTLNVPSFAWSRLHVHIELVAASLCLFAVGFLL